MARTAALLLCLLLVIGCDTGERISRLEKQTADLKAEVDRDQAARDFDLQAKCAKDARVWFIENWQRDKDTLFLDYEDHYSKSLSSCFIDVELHTQEDTGKTGNDAWNNDISLWNVYENSKYGQFFEDHFTDFKHPPTDNVTECDVAQQKCTSPAQFNSLASRYMAN